MLGIALHQNAQNVKQWGATYGATFPLLMDPTYSVYSAYGDWFVPYNVVIDTAMILRYTDSGYNEAAMLAIIKQYLPPAVPVELASFSASFKNNEVELSWTTASETNNFGFDVERSSDQKNFDRIGFVKGYQTATITQHYSFIDNKVTSGKYYYRLKQIDNDGSFQYSDIISIDIKIPLTFRLEQNFPNPFNPGTEISFVLSESSQIKLQIFDLLGKEIFTLIDSKYNAGYHSIRWDGRDNDGRLVPSGVYLYQLQGRNFIQAKKMSLVR